MRRLAASVIFSAALAAACGGVETDELGVSSAAVVTETGTATVEAESAPVVLLVTSTAPGGTNPKAASQDPMPVMPNVAQPNCQPGQPCGDVK